MAGLLTTPDRFFWEETTKTIWDRHLGRRYSTVEEIYSILREINEFLADYDSFIGGDIDAIAEEFTD